MSAPPWEKMDVAWWPVIAAALVKPWPTEAMLFDLRWWEDQEDISREKRPGRLDEPRAGLDGVRGLW